MDRNIDTIIPKGFFRLKKMFKKDMIKVGLIQYPSIDIVLYKSN